MERILQRCAYQLQTCYLIPTPNTLLCVCYKDIFSMQQQCNYMNDKINTDKLLLTSNPIQLLLIVPKMSFQQINVIENPILFHVLDNFKNVSFNLKQFFTLFWVFIIITLQAKYVVLQNASQSGFTGCCLMIRYSLCNLKRRLRLPFSYLFRHSLPNLSISS